VWGRGGYGFHFSFDDDFGFIVDDAFVTALDKSLETRWPEISKILMKRFVYHCVLLPACPFEVVDAVPFAVGLAEAGVICRPPATLVYAGSTQCQCMKHAMRDNTVHLQMSLCLSVSLFSWRTHLSTILALS